MSIERQIKQTSFRNEYQKATVNLVFTAFWFQEKVRLFLDGKDITMQQYNILCILRSSDNPLSTQQIRERMLDKMSDTSRLVNRLIQKGFAKKKINSADKRLVDVTISNKGITLLESLDKKDDELDDIVGLSPEEATTLSQLLDKMRKPRII